MRPRIRQWSEVIVEKSLLVIALFTIIVITLITWFVVSAGYPVLSEVGIWQFISGTKWHPTDGEYGIWPMIVGSVLVTIGALGIGVPLGVIGAIFLAEVAPPKVARVIRSAVELLAGIPSVVYGFFGLVVIVPFLREFLGGSGFSVVAGSIILGIMILPTILSISETSLRAVPREFKEGSLALGANHWQTIKWIFLPVARSGILAAIILGMGRAIGETMAVIMVTGNVALVPHALSDPIRTLTGNVVMEMSYASGRHQQALFATGIVLFFFVMLLNLLMQVISRRKVDQA
ncbi:MAG: phosphate ABC transporter permease subunit PstC [Syntrophomonadaceae bacterium]|nr:phosphate ABC transporter permease subunit PstC [Syntrophomonadaceae bacterium]